MAYYREARNPSDVETLCELAGEIGINVQKFQEQMANEACQAMLERDVQKTHALGVTGFPSLVLATDDGTAAIPHDYTDPLITLKAIDLKHSS